MGFSVNASVLASNVRSWYCKCCEKPWIPVIVLAVLYLPRVCNGWLGLDDKVFLMANSHIGLTPENLRWAWCTGGPWHRYCPMFWTVVDFCGNDVVTLHLVTLVMAGVFVAVLWEVVRDFLVSDVATTVVVMVFVAYPTRAEVFGWEMGIVYLGMGIFALLSWYFRGTWLSVGCLVVSVLFYPQAVGVGLVLVGCSLIQRRFYVAWWVLFVCVADVCVQVCLRAQGKVVHFAVWEPVNALGHYMFGVCLPWASTPLVPAVQYYGVFVGVFLFSVWCAVDWRWALVWLCVLAPTLVAGITEPFWYAGRYSLLPDVVVLLFLATRFKGWWEAYWEARVCWLGWWVLLLAVTVCQAPCWHSVGPIFLLSVREAQAMHMTVRPEVVRLLNQWISNGR